MVTFPPSPLVQVSKWSHLEGSGCCYSNGCCCSMYIHTYICSSLYMPFDVDGLHFTLQLHFQHSNDFIHSSFMNVKYDHVWNGLACQFCITLLLPSTQPVCGSLAPLHLTGIKVQGIMCLAEAPCQAFGSVWNLIDLMYNVYCIYVKMVCPQFYAVCIFSCTLCVCIQSVPTSHAALY